MYNENIVPAQHDRNEVVTNLKVVLEPSEEWGYTVYIPSLPGCTSEGETEEESLHNIQEAIALYLEPVEDDLIQMENEVVQEVEV